MPDYPKSPGCVWEREDKRGKWLSISLDVDTMNTLINMAPGDKISLVAFPNDKKKSDKSPDYWIQPPREEKPPKTVPASGGNDSGILF